jgi:hypothetical protein
MVNFAKTEKTEKPEKIENGKAEKAEEFEKEKLSGITCCCIIKIMA